MAVISKEHSWSVARNGANGTVSVATVTLDLGPVQKLQESKEENKNKSRVEM